MPLGVYEIAVVGHGPLGEAIVNTFNYSSPEDSNSPTNAQNILDAFWDAVMAAYMDALCDDWVGYMIKLVSIYGPNIGATAERDISDVTGVLAGAPAPLQTTAILQRRTALNNRHGRGRLYLSPIPAADVSISGRYTDTAGATADLGVALMTDLALLESVYRPCLWNPTQLVATPITSFVVGKLAGVRRSRRVRFPN